MIGTTISHYRILEKLGEGGMGVVYKAQDTRLERLVALKFLPPDLYDASEAKQRFITEARAASSLNHPNVATVYDIGEADLYSFIAMELVEGETLKSRLKADRLTIEQVKTMGLQIAEGLQAAHAKGIVHRDIKPDNLLLTRNGHIKIMDFGVAKVSGSGMTRTGTTVGTLAYMSPEQLVAEDVDNRSDLWSFGVVLYEMLTGELPFRRGNEAAIIYEILNRDPTPLEVHRTDVPPTLRAVISQLLQKDPAARPASAGDVIARLRGTGVPAAASAPAKTIAVLYFENLSSEKESDYFCAGITEDIITDLSKLRDLRVVPRSDVLPFRNKEVNTRQIGDALRVNYILEGSVRKAGSRIRITAQLVSARDGYPVWADRFDGLVDDIFDLQNEASRKIVDALKVSLTEAEKESLAKKPTDDLRAYDFYMRGREYLNRRGRKNTEAALRMFENALGIDADFAAAFSAMGEACASMYEWYDGRSHWLARAIELNQEALARDPNSLDVQFGIAMVYAHQGRLLDAKRAMLAILESDPQYYPACLRLGMLAERAGDSELQSAVSWYRRAADLHPHDDDPWRHLAGLYRKLGQVEAAHEAALKVIEITSRKLEASLDDVVVTSRLAEGYARYGGKEETHAILKRVLQLDPSDGQALYHSACAYALLGERNATLTSLRSAFDNGFRAVAHAVRADSAFDSLRSQSEFQTFIAELR
jgi:serine/threonine protein kinase/cytochrome c-type biogenesis protein CcmH/NrfG